MSQSAPPPVEHVRLDADTLSTGDTYRLMTDLVAPRPIAWVSTLDPHGHANLAPFSYFQAVCSRPPIVMLSISHRSDGRPKDTLRNVLDTGELVVNHVSEPLVEAMNRTSGEHEPHVDEWSIAWGETEPRLEAAPSIHVRPPRVAGALAAMEARLQHAIPLGEAPHGGPSSTLVLARVLCFHVAAPLVERDAQGRLRLPLDPARLSAVGRLGGIAYARTRERIELPRPKGRL
jgi:flavin reductase (DIM6/NTAB) family NADH-FMN oxidoreductase RutF